MGNISSTQTAFFDPVTGTFSAGPDKGDLSSEESFALLPDGTVLAVNCSSIPNTEKYLPATNRLGAGSLHALHAAAGLPEPRRRNRPHRGLYRRQRPRNRCDREHRHLHAAG